MATPDEAAKVDDIEMQLLNTTLRSDQSTPPTTNAESDKDNKVADVEAAAESVVNKPTTTTFSDDFVISEGIVVKIFFTCICILLLPLFVVFAIPSYCISGDLKDPDELFSRKKNGDHQKGVYLKMLHFKSTKQKFQRLNVVFITRVGCFVLLWLVLNTNISSLKSVMLFEYPLWKWTLLALIILLGYTVSCITIVLIMSLTKMALIPPNSLYFEYVEFKLSDSLASLLHFVAIIAIWLCYFRTDRGLNPSERLDRFGTGTFVSLLIGAILWVLKSATLLKWESNAVHKRFAVRILTAVFQLYFLTLITDGAWVAEFLPWREEYEHRKCQTNIINSDGTARDRTNLRIKDFISSKPAVSVYEINRVARHVMDLTKVTPRDNDGIPEVVAKYQQKIPTQQLGETITEQALKENFGLRENSASHLLQWLKEDQMSGEITYDTFQKWMVDAHKNCLSVGYTLIDAFAVVSMLNRILIGFIIVVVILVWLLITGLATTKVLLLIASPFLAFSFMFGDTCKTFFQGIIFSFVTHPYDVGDRCIIEGTEGIELEVKRIGVLTTKFLKIGTKEEIIYANTSLSTKRITNHKGEPDPRDQIELKLDSSTTKVKIEELMNDLMSFFGSSDRDGHYDKNVQLAVKEIGSSIKMSISFTHVMNVHDVSHSQCLQRKNKQRSELLIEIKQFLEDREIKLATP